MVAIAYTREAFVRNVPIGALLASNGHPIVSGIFAFLGIRGTRGMKPRAKSKG